MCILLLEHSRDLAYDIHMINDNGSEVSAVDNAPYFPLFVCLVLASLENKKSRVH